MRVDNVEGRDFERKILGKNGKFLVVHNKKDITFTDAIRRTLADWDGSTCYPDTPEANVLYYRVRKYLLGFGVKIQSLVFLRSVESAADVLYQTDAAFYLITESGKEYLVTIDLSFSSNPDVEESYSRVINQSYLELQTELYQWKRVTTRKGKIKVKVYWQVERPDNHFILTQFDVCRRRGLKTLGREIASSLFRQVKEGEGEKLINKP